MLEDKDQCDQAEERKDFYGFYNIWFQENLKFNHNQF